MARHLTPQLEATVDALGGAAAVGPPAEDGSPFEILGREIAVLERQIAESHGASAFDLPEVAAANRAAIEAEGRARAVEKAGELLAGGKV